MVKLDKEVFKVKKKELLIILKAWKKMLTPYVGWISRDERAFKKIKELITKSGEEESLIDKIELFRFLLDGEKIGSIWISLKRGFTEFVGDRKKMEEFMKELEGNPIICLGENTEKKEIK